MQMNMSVTRIAWSAGSQLLIPIKLYEFLLGLNKEANVKRIRHKRITKIFTLQCVLSLSKMI